MAIKTNELYPNALGMGAMLMEYRIAEVLGVGGFGITYRAQDTLLEKDVAIKEYFPNGVVQRRDEAVKLTGPHNDAEYFGGLDRFLKEARTLATFGHPNIVRVLRYFKANDTGYMVMDYEHGSSLRDWLQANPQPEEEALLALVAPLLDGIEKVHAAGFLHRDIKPDNVFMRETGEPVLIDFGSARQSVNATRALTAMVTPGYAPFEQYGTGSEQGPWTDIYALGAVLFYCMTGRNPPDAIARMKQDRLGDELGGASLRYSPRVLDAVRRAMALDDKNRPRSVGEWRPSLLGTIPARNTVPVTAPPVTAPGAVRTERVPVATEHDAATDTQDISRLLERRDELERAVKEKFQRVLTVMFTDLKGSTAIAEAQGDIAVRGMLKRYHDLVTVSVRSNSGVLVKTIGDGSLCHFEDALNACRAAAAIQRGMEAINIAKDYKTILLARIGLHTGECLLEKNDVFGDVVNTASRFESSAHPGEILVSEDTYNAMSDKTEFYARFDREVTLKGKSQPYKAYVVFWDPKEIERDRASPAASAAKPSTPVWKLGVMIGVPLVAILMVALWITSGGKIGGEDRRSINYSVPQK
ncbi:MAG: protein kinase [Burkholderiales bacterium]|nr:protein kinase [Burkholderiales bacterium]